MSNSDRQKLDPLEQALLRRLEEGDRMPDGIPGLVIWALLGILALLFASIGIWAIVAAWVKIVETAGGGA
ncbi:MAG: hypothetical protein ACK5XN_17490 [Bacteroidota bacterium]|jgi:hypothetical protein